jgi:hypothetical protein
MTNYADIERAFLLYKNRKTPEEPVPKGWFTAEQAAKQKNISVRDAQRMLRILYSDGSVLMQKFRIKSGLRVYPIPHYRFPAKGVQP